MTLDHLGGPHDPPEAAHGPPGASRGVTVAHPKSSKLWQVSTDDTLSACTTARGFAASWREHMTSGHIATAGVSRKSRRQHTPDSRYGRYGTSAMRSVHLAFRSKRGAQSPQITSFHPTFRTPDRSLGIYYVWLLFGPHMMSTTVLKYVRYINLRRTTGQSSAAMSGSRGAPRRPQRFPDHGTTFS